MYFRPDDCVPGKNATWRAVVEDYNRRGENEIRFWEAFKLYEPRQPYSDIYLNLQDFADRENHEFFIFSAGWGMVRSTYQLPYYEITFTRPESPEKRYVFRSKDRYQDFQHLTNPETSPIVIFAGQNYVEQLYSLMRGVGGRKLVFYFQSSNHNKKSYENGGEHGYEYLPYVPPVHMRDSTRIWHYQCAKDFIENPRVREWAFTPANERTKGADIEKLWKDMRSSVKYNLPGTI